MFRQQSFIRCLVVLATGVVSGCAGVSSVAPEAAGLGAGAGAGVLTANPLIGVAVGLGARLATAEALGAIEASHQRELQRAIASAAGGTPVGEAAHWFTNPSPLNRLLFGRTSGTVQVSREFGGRILCREILYTTDADGGVVGLVDMDDVGSDSDSTIQSGHAAPDKTTSDKTPIGLNDITGTDHGTESTAAADDELSSAHEPPEVPNVLVAMICRGATGAQWQWAVSEPAE